jgi:ABC-type sugar transport system substrate-binding protein
VKNLRFVVSLITQDNDYQIEQAAAAEDVARRLGVDVEIIFADNDSIRQSQQVINVIQSSSSHPDGVILESVSGTALPQVARAAVAADIGWAVLNLAPDYISGLRQNYRVPIFSLASDNEEVGRFQGRQIAALLPNGGRVLHIQGPSDSTTAKMRTDGMTKAKAASVQTKCIRAHWTEASAYKAVTAWLRLTTSQQAGIDLIASHNDAMAMGARKAFQELPDASARERWQSLPYIGCDGVPKTGQAWVRVGALAATVITPPLAGQAIEMLANAIHTSTMPPSSTLVAPRSFPALTEITAFHPQKTRAATSL